ncbi:MAG: hypothetical protein NW224_25780 [Leptolyngbyaceae cyanobacterium bins.302]|nr:hypothetical protein [Leptolyngbyaceae cyanobacterium bins.302]
MNVAVQQEGLKRISRYLQEQLKPQSQVTPLQVQCALKEGLMVLVQHPPGNAPDPQQIFKILEQAIATLPSNLLATLPPTLAGSQSKLFLRVLGQQKPYAFHHVVFPAANPFQAPAAIVDDELHTVIQAPVSDPPPESTTSASSQNEPLSPQPEPTEAESINAPGGEIVYSSTLEPDEATAEGLSNYDPRSQPVTSGVQRSWVKPLLLAGGGVAAALLLGVGLYALTRPCVIGTCSNLETAQSLSQQAAQTLKTGKPEESAQQATQQLTEAKRLLAEIPGWSGQHGNVQALQQQLDQVLAAEAQATEASQQGQSAAQPATEWQTTQSLWQSAIAQLEKISPDSPLHAFAQERLTAYRANLAFTGQRIGVEQDAQKRLAAARKTAELATARQNVAQKPAEWQQAQVTWQVVVNTLQQIPNGTTAYAEAQQLLESYRPKLASSRDRVTKEQLAQKVYNQATNYEKQAKASQQSNQWSQAAVSWQNALNAAKQVPAGTSVSETAQARASDYAGFLKQAQTVVKIRGDLDRVCLASGKICDYTITNEAIQVKFVPAYERKVRTLGGISQYSGDYDTMYKVNSHLASLGNALQAVSNNAGIPVQVYNSDNQLLGAFVPGG